METTEFERDLLARIVQNVKPSKAAIFTGEKLQMAVSHGVETDESELNLDLIKKVAKTKGPVSERIEKRQLAVPYKNAEGEMLGIMYVEISEPRRLKFRDLAILQGLGRQMVERNSQQSETAPREISSEALQELTRFAKSTRNIVSSVLKPQRLMIVVKLGDEPRVVASRGFPEESDLGSLPISLDMLHAMWQKGETCHIGDALNDPEYSTFAGVSEHNIRSVCVCPLNKLDGEDRGVIYLDSCKDPSEFLTAEVSILKRLALALEKDLAKVLSPKPDDSSALLSDVEDEYALPDVGVPISKPTKRSDSKAETPTADPGKDSFQMPEFEASSFNASLDWETESTATAPEPAETVEESAVSLEELQPSRQEPDEASVGVSDQPQLAETEEVEQSDDFTEPGLAEPSQDLKNHPEDTLDSSVALEAAELTEAEPPLEEGDLEQVEVEFDQSHPQPEDKANEATVESVEPSQEREDAPVAVESAELEEDDPALAAEYLESTQEDYAGTAAVETDERSEPSDEVSVEPSEVAEAASLEQEARVESAELGPLGENEEQPEPAEFPEETEYGAGEVERADYTEPEQDQTAEDVEEASVAVEAAEFSENEPAPEFDHFEQAEQAEAEPALVETEDESAPFEDEPAPDADHLEQAEQAEAEPAQIGADEESAPFEDEPAPDADHLERAEQADAEPAQIEADEEPASSDDELIEPSEDEDDEPSADESEESVESAEVEVSEQHDEQPESNEGTDEAVEVDQSEAFEDASIEAEATEHIEAQPSPEEEHLEPAEAVNEESAQAETEDESAPFEDEPAPDADHLERAEQADAEPAQIEADEEPASSDDELIEPSQDEHDEPSADKSEESLESAEQPSGESFEEDSFDDEAPATRVGVGAPPLASSVAEPAAELEDEDSDVITIPREMDDESEEEGPIEPTIEETVPKLKKPADREVEAVRALPVDSTVEVSADVAARVLAQVQGQAALDESQDQQEPTSSESAEVEQAEPESSPESAPETEEPESAAEPEPDPGPELETDPEPEHAAEPEPGADPEPASKAEPEPEQNSASEPEPEPQPQKQEPKPPKEVTEQEESLTRYVEVGLMAVTPARKATFWERLKWVFSPDAIPGGGDYSHVHVSGKVVLDGGWKGSQPVEVSIRFPSHNLRVVLELGKEQKEFSYHGRFKGECPENFELKVEKPGYFPIKISKKFASGDGEPSARVGEITLIPKD